MTLTYRKSNKNRPAAPLKMVKMYQAVLACAIFPALSTTASSQGMPPAPVRAAAVTRAVITEPIILSGSVQPLRQTQISAETAGLVQEVLVDEGDYVEENQILARLRSKPGEIRLKEFEGDLLIEQAKLDELANGTRQEDIAAEKADVDEASANVDFWVSEEKRLRELFEDNAVSESEYQSSKATMQRAKATLNLESAEYDRAIKGPREEVIRSQMGEVSSRQAAVDLQKDIIDRHAIRAPFSGIIGVKAVEKGQWVQTGSVVFGMAQIDTLRVEVPLPERHFSKVGIGTEAEVQFPALPGEKMKAKVTARIPLANIAARTFPVRIEFENSEFNIAPGMFASVILYPSEANENQALLVPKDAVVTSSDKSQTVYVIRDGDGGSAAFPVNVTTGRTVQDRVEIFTEELDPGNQVIIRGNETIRFPGQNVRVLGESSSNMNNPLPLTGAGG